MPGKLSTDIISQWWKAGQLFKYAELLVCLEHSRGDLSIQRLWYLHSSFIVIILYDPSLHYPHPVLTTCLSPPVLPFIPMWLFEFLPSRTWQNIMWPVSSLSPPTTLLLLPVTKIWEVFECTFTSFYNQRDIDIYLGQQILRSKTCWHTLGSIARLV